MISPLFPGSLAVAQSVSRKSVGPKSADVSGGIWGASDESGGGSCLSLAWTVYCFGLWHTYAVAGCGRRGKTLSPSPLFSKPSRADCWTTPCRGPSCPRDLCPKPSNANCSFVLSVANLKGLLRCSLAVHSLATYICYKTAVSWHCYVPKFKWL